MKKYKRLTRRKADGRWGFADDFAGFYNPKLETMAGRLCDLEDKVENGTLVELPCKVGDTVYEVYKNHNPLFIQQTKIEKIIITGKGLRLKLARNSTYETSIASFGKTLFLTEAEAQKALKEFENGKTRAY